MTTFVLKKLPKARAREESRAGARAAALTACSDDAPAPTGHASGLGRALQKKTDSLRARRSFCIQPLTRKE